MVFKILMGNYFYLEIIREALNLFSLSSRNYWSNSSTQMTELKKKKKRRERYGNKKPGIQHNEQGMECPGSNLYSRSSG